MSTVGRDVRSDDQPRRAAADRSDLEPLSGEVENSVARSISTDATRTSNNADAVGLLAAATVSMTFLERQRFASAVDVDARCYTATTRTSTSSAAASRERSSGSLVST